MSKDRDDLDRDLREEIESHLRMRAEHSGLTSGQARQRFGNPTQIQEEMRTMHLSARVDEILQDLRYAMRRARRMPGFTLAVVAAIAIGIGSCTAVFSVVDRILFRPLPYAHEEQLVWLGMTAPIGGGDEFLLGGDYFEWKEQQQVFSHFTASRGTSDCDVTEDSPLRLRCLPVTSDYLATFGFAPAVGRMFDPAEKDHVLISYELWKNRFGANPAVSQHTIQLDGKPWRIAGVLPAQFEMPGLAKVDILMPLGLDEASERSRKRQMTFLNAWARLKPGVSIQQAQAAMQPLYQNSLKFVPAAFLKEIQFKISPLRERQTRKSRTVSLALFAAVLSVLLIACANVANLFLARASAAERESAIRTAIGASRSRLLRQNLTESLLLTSAGGLLGVGLGWMLLTAAWNLAPTAIPRLESARLDGRVLAFCFGLTVLCGLVCGIVPAFHRISIQALTGGRTTAGGSWARPALVVCQIALASALLYASSLLGESLWRMQHVPLGIDTGNLISTNINLRNSRFGQAALRDEFWNSLNERLRRLPGIASFALSDSLPPSGRAMIRIFSRIRIDGKAEDLRGGTGGMVIARSVQPGYFETLKIPTRHGRTFTEADQLNKQQPPIILSEVLARKLFGRTDVLGRSVQPGVDAPWSTIVGVVGDTKNNGFEKDDPEFYLPLDRPSDRMGLTLLARTSGNSKLVQELIRAEIAAFDSHIPLQFETMEQRTSKLTEGPRFNTAVLALFSLAGLILGATGIYSVVSFLVSQRTKEIGVRMALGATSEQIRSLILSNALRWTAAGCVAGIVIIAVALPYLRSLLFETQPARIGSGIAVLVGMGFVAILSALVPALRAARLDPIQTLRHD